MHLNQHLHQQLNQYASRRSPQHAAQHPFLLAKPAARGWPRWTLLLCVVAWLMLYSLGARAQVQVPAQAIAQEPDYATMALKWARHTLAQSQPDAQQALRMELTVGALDSRLRLAPCGNVEAYLPPGARLWGHSRVGLRCVDGMGKWNVTVPLQVKAFGNAWVVRGQVMAGSPVLQNAVALQEVDWAEDSYPVLLDSAQWLGQTAARTLSSGQVLRQGAVRPTQVFQAGTQVRVVAEGRGFEVSSDAQALGVGVVGQSTRVRMDNGRITSGTVLDARTVKIEL